LIYVNVVDSQSTKFLFLPQRADWCTKKVFGLLMEIKSYSYQFVLFVHFQASIN